MAKTAKAQTPPRNSKPTSLTRNTKTGSTPSKAGDSAPSTLPKSLINGLPSSANIMASMMHVGIETAKLLKEVDAARKAGAVPLARAYVVLHRLDERIKELLKPLAERTKSVKELEIPEVFEIAGVPSITLDEGFRVGVSVRTLASIKTGQKEAAIEWLNGHDKGDVVQSTINASTLSALAKELGGKNIDLPDDIFSVARVPNTSVTKT